MVTWRVGRRGIALSTLAAICALSLLAVEPVAAQSVNKRLIENLNRKLLYMALPVAIAVELMLFYTVYRYRKSKNPEATPTEENRTLEITWTVATALVLLFVGITASTVLANSYVSPTAGNPDTEANVSNPHLQGAVVPDDPSAVEVNVLAYKWGWQFSYPGTNVTAQNALVIPKGREVYLHVTSQEIIHSFYSPQLGVKRDAMPNQYNTIHTRVTREGEYRAYCAEFCGSGHAQMTATIRVVSEEEYRTWLERRASGSGGSAADGAAAANETRAANGTASTAEPGATATTSRTVAP